MTWLDPTDLTNYQLNGTATRVEGGAGTVISLTSAGGSEAGSANLQGSSRPSLDGVQLGWTVQSDAGGADGWVAYFYDADEAPDTALGTAGGGRGCAGTPAVGFGVEEFYTGLSELLLSDTGGGLNSAATVTETNAAVTGTHAYTMLLTAFDNDGDAGFLFTVARDGTALFDNTFVPFTASSYGLGFSAGTGGAAAAHALLAVTFQAPVDPPNLLARRQAL